MQQFPDNETETKNKINRETAVIAWKELARFFAAGQCVYVAPQLDLVAVAYQIAEDNADQIKAWMANGELAKVSDQQARIWLEEDRLLWSAVVKPWVLVQEKQ